MATNQPTNDQRIALILGKMSNESATNQEKDELILLLRAKHEEVGRIINLETAVQTRIEQAASELFNLHLRGVSIEIADDVQLGDALRGAMLALSTVVVMALDKRGETFIEAFGYLKYQYTSEAIGAISDVVD